METVKAITIKPLNGDPAGTLREFSLDDFQRLEALGAVKMAEEPKNKIEPVAQNKASTRRPRPGGGAA